MKDYFKQGPIYATITGPIVMVGFGSIGKGTLPLIQRHFKYDKSRMVVIDPKDTNKNILDQRGIPLIQKSLLQDNYKQILTPLLTKGDGKGFLVNLSVDTGSLDIMKLCRQLNVLYIDTVIEPWAGFYFNRQITNCQRSNYMMRQKVLHQKKQNSGGSTAVSCCGANPGMVSWLLKQGLLKLLQDTKGVTQWKPKNQKQWATLAKQLGVKGVHIAQRDTQKSNSTKPINSFWNTWSVQGFLCQAMQPSQLGWGTHQKWLPENAKLHQRGCKAAIYINKPGAKTQVRTWCPISGPQIGFLVTHNEAISIADYFSIIKDDQIIYRITSHYAYHPCDQAIISMYDMLGRGVAPDQAQNQHILDQKDIVEGVDQLGVLIYGHQKNALWYGSRLSIQETKRLAPYQNATGLQVSSAVLAGMVWAIENPMRGIVEAEEMDYERCLEIQKPYLGKVFGQYTDWNPLKGQIDLFPQEIDQSDPWQFKNVLML